MLRTNRLRWPPGRRGLFRAAAAGAALALCVGTPLLAGAAQAAPAATGITIGVANGPFGKMLVAESGPYAGFTLYEISSDVKTVSGYSYGCTTALQTLVFGPYHCTGPEADMSAEWPALTTPAAPVAGAGVNKSLLGDVSRSGVGTGGAKGLQVTYAGKPLYLFDQFPTLVSGEGWFEPTLPKDFGVWWTISPDGQPLPWAQTLGVTQTYGGKTVLGALMVDGGNTILFPAYTYTKGTTNGTGCTGSCAAAWPPVITQGRPGLLDGIPAADVGLATRAGGLHQLTWKGKALYFFADEGIKVSETPPKVGFFVEGNGNGIAVNGGTFDLVTNP